MYSKEIFYYKQIVQELIENKEMVARHSSNSFGFITTFSTVFLTDIVNCSCSSTDFTLKCH